MDHTSIPVCALYRNTGTIIVRLKMEVTTSCCKREVYTASGYPEVVHRPSGCEQCTRTRIISQYSDCDSSVVEKHRPYRSSAARSRYVNVCAAVCLLLLVGSLSPRSSAAPHRSRASMERQRRDVDKESELWENPCDYNSKPNISSDRVKDIALKLVKEANSAVKAAYEYNETFAKLHSYQTFSADLLRNWESYDGLRKGKGQEDTLPKEKVLNQTMPDEYIEDVVKNFDEKLPSLYMGLKMIVAGLYNFSTNGLNYNVVNDDILKQNMNKTMHDVRAVLCYVNDIMIARNLSVQPLLKEDIPDFENLTSFGLILYRDTLNYLQYLIQVFSKVAEKGV